jgi:hypothetical protein
LSVVNRLLSAIMAKDIDAFAAPYADGAVLREPLHPEQVGPTLSLVQQEEYTSSEAPRLGLKEHSAILGQATGRAELERVLFLGATRPYKSSKSVEGLTGLRRVRFPSASAARYEVFSKSVGKRAYLRKPVGPGGTADAAPERQRQR